jgi:hypothetical protein
MVVEFLMEMIGGVIRGLVSLLPASPVNPDEVGDSFYSVGGMASALNGYVPILALAAGITVLIGFRLALLLWQGIMFVYHQFWGSS